MAVKIELVQRQRNGLGMAAKYSDTVAGSENQRTRTNNTRLQCRGLDDSESSRSAASVDLHKLGARLALDVAAPVVLALAAVVNLNLT